MVDSTMLGPALDYAERGWAVLPIFWIDPATGVCGCNNPFCKAVGKHPTISGGVKSASKDPEVVRGWWTTWPQANIAIACGEASGVLVIDLDVDDDGKDGNEELTVYLASRQVSLERETLIAQSGGGGRHLFYQYPEGVVIKNLVGWMPGVDVRSNNGYVLVAPSKHESGQRYTWLTDYEVKPLTARVIQDLTTAKGGRGKRAASRDEVLAPPYDYQDAIDNGPPKGARDHFFNAYAYTLRKLNNGPEDALKLLRAAWSKTDQPPGDEYPWETVLDKMKRVWETVEPDPMLPVYNPNAALALEPKDLGEDESEPEEVPVSLTELGTARRLVDTYGHFLKYNQALGWLVWDYTHWARDESDRVLRAVQLVLNQMEDEGRRDASPQTREPLLRWVDQCRSNRRIREIAAAANFQAEIRVNTSRLDSDHYLLACKNGTIDLRTGEIREASSADLITRRSEVEFDAEFRSDAWDQFIEDVTAGDVELAQYIQRAAGYTMTSNTDEDAFFIVHGLPGSGKSTFLDAMISCLGQMAMCIDHAVIASRRDKVEASEVAHMFGKRLVAVSETPEGMRFNESAVKKMSGGDRLAGRHLYKERIEFDVSHKLWIVTNHLPKMDDRGMWRRVKPVPFKYRPGPTGPDFRLRDMAKHPESEFTRAAMAWMVKGCLAWQKEGLGSCAAIQAEISEYHDDEDRLSRFIEEECILDPNASTTSAALFERWQDWCHRQGEYVGSNIAFSRRVRAEGVFTRHRDNRGQRAWLGVKLQEGSTWTPS